MATLNISLTEEMRSYVAQRIASGRYGSASEYFRELLRRDQDQLRREALEQALLEGVQSGEPSPLTAEDLDDVRSYVRKLAANKPRGLSRSVLIRA